MQPATGLSSEKQAPEIIELLVAEGAGLNTTDNNGNSALLFAIALTLGTLEISACLSSLQSRIP